MKHANRVPRQLECEHTFCTVCIQKLFDLQGQGVVCPLNCKKVTVVPAEGVGELVRNISVLGLKENSKDYDKCKNCIKTTYPPKSATMHCLDCNTSYCGACSDVVHLKIENQDHLIRLSKSRDDLSTSRTNLSSAQSNKSDKPKPHSGLLEECDDHGLPLKIYCKHDKVMICTLCRTSNEQHSNHDCNKMNIDEEKQRDNIYIMQDEVDLMYERFLRARGVVQNTIEQLKTNSSTAKDQISRAFRSMRTTVDDTERMLIGEIDLITQNRLHGLRKQLSEMIEVSSKAKAVSRGCEHALTLEYFEMLSTKHKLDGEHLTVMGDMQKTDPIFPSELSCQFPNNETIIGDIIKSGYIVRVSPPPSDFNAILNDSKDIFLSWNRPLEMAFTYLPTLYIVYATTGENDAYVQFTQVSTPSCTISRSHPDMVSRPNVQFKVTSVNAVGESDACHPRCVYLSSSR